jgi:hypothetical protein
MNERQTLFRTGIGDHNGLSIFKTGGGRHIRHRRFPPQNNAGPTGFNRVKNDLMMTNPND